MSDPGARGAPAAIIPDAGPVWRQARRTMILGTLFALAGAALYGANIPAARAASQAGMPGAELTLYRSMLLVPLLGLASLVLGQSLRPSPGEFGTLARLGLAAGFTATFYLSSLDHLPVPLAVVLFYTFPLIVMVASNRIERRRLSVRQIGVFAGAFAGLLLAVGPSFESLSMRGAAYAFIAALACAGLFIIASRTTGPAVRTMFWTQVGMTPIALAFVLLSGGPGPLTIFAKAPLAIGIAMGAFAIAFVFQLLAAQRISATRAGLLFLFEPVTAILIAGVVLGETLAPIQMGGVVLILAALSAEILLDTPRAAKPGLPDDPRPAP